MLCFIFSALIVALDQFFKHWISRTLGMGEIGPEIIPGVLGLTRWENDGAMLNILSGQQWLLAGIAFAAAFVLVMILLRYNEGFWGTLGLAAVLGGTIGNLADRIFNDGAVVDMFRTLFITFPIFNIADIFITLGFMTFLIHFIAISFKTVKREAAEAEFEQGEPYYEQEPEEYEEYHEAEAIAPEQAGQLAAADYSAQPDVADVAAAPVQYDPVSPVSYTPEDYVVEMPADYDPITETTPDSLYTLDALEAELDSLDDYNVDDLLREYGFEDSE
jgi:signal peptidase II